MQSLKINRIKEILEQYNNRLPLPVADYFFRLYLNNILFKKGLNHHILFGKILLFFLDKRYDIFYLFDITLSDNEEYTYATLNEIQILIAQEENITQDFSFFNNLNQLFNSNTEISWYDEPILIKNKNYVAEFKIIF